MPRVPDVLSAGTCGKLLWSSTTSLPEGQAMCRECRKAKPWEHGTRRGYRDNSCRCTDCTNWNAKEHYKYEQRRAAGEFKTTPCEASDCTRIAYARGMCKMHYRRWARSNGYVQSPSDAWSDTRRSNYHARRARLGGARSNDKVLRAALIERDGLDCSACGHGIDIQVQWPHPLSISIDHTMPVSRGGQHTLNNTTLMHLRCNISKGARVEVPDANAT